MIKGEIMNNGTVDVNDLYLRIYGYDESGKLFVAVTTPVSTGTDIIKPKDSRIFDTPIIFSGREIKSWKIETN